jgi:hypothetical protein
MASAKWYILTKPCRGRHVVFSQQSPKQGLKKPGILKVWIHLTISGKRAQTRKKSSTIWPTKPSLWTGAIQIQKSLTAKSFVTA